MAAMGNNRIYVCGNNAYESELAMVRHEGLGAVRRGRAAPVFETRPPVAFRIREGGEVRWATDPVEVFRLRRRNPDALVEVVRVRR